MKKLIKNIINKKVCIISFIIWTILHISGISNLFLIEYSPERMILYSLLHLIFIYILIFNISNIIKNKEKEMGNITWKSFIIVFSILLGLLLIMWPGTWSWDDIFILDSASYLQPLAWQHFICSVFYILCIETIPLPAGIIFIQIIIISIIISNSITKIIDVLGTKNNKAIVLGIAIISLFPPIVLYLLSGFRMGLYSFFELYFIVNLIYIYCKNKKINISQIIILCFFATIIASWRTEGIYYCMMFPIILLLMDKKIISKKMIFICFIVVTSSTLIIMKYNNYLIGSNNYSLTATINPVSELVKKADKSDEKYIKKIDKVVDTNFIKKNPKLNGEGCYWSGVCVKKYSNKEYKDYLKAYMKLGIKYPDVVFKSMWSTFYDGGSGQGKGGYQTTRNVLHKNATTNIYEKDTKVYNKWYEFNSKYKFPINKSIRKKVILLLGGTDEKGKINIIHRVFWNYIIPILLLLLLLILNIIRKRWFISVIIFTILLKIPILFISSPAPYFMYYLSVYLCGYILFFMEVCSFVRDKKKQNRSIDKKESIDVKHIWNQFISFILISGVGWCIDFVIYNLLTIFLNFRVLYANILSSIPAITYVFLMSNKKIFKNTKSKLNLRTKYIIYFGYQIILLLVVSNFGELLYKYLYNIVTIKILLSNLKLFIKIIITPITMTLNFIIMKNLIEKI